ncbi:MAG: hypothetical protein DME46_11040 [Verrucomicrobia bacterium]|nr:MAG: hypothetical protein DME46_11040 [Verrucomicrobiota bacterium]
MAAGLASCGKSDSGGTGSGAGQSSGTERAAADAALAEVKKHWTKGAEGWMTARNSGSSYAPVRFIRQFRELTVDGVRSADLSESDRMNGLEWAGEVSFKQAPCREAGDQGILLDGLANVTTFRQRGRWTQWVDFQPEPVQIQKVKATGKSTRTPGSFGETFPDPRTLVTRA